MSIINITYSTQHDEDQLLKILSTNENTQELNLVVENYNNYNKLMKYLN